MLLRIKQLALFASIIIATGATDTAQTAAVEPETDVAADTTIDRDLYGKPSDDDVIRRITCPDDKWCRTQQQCEDSQAAREHDFNGAIDARCMGGCVLKDGGKVSWVRNNDYKLFRSSCAPDAFSRVCCDDDRIPTYNPTESPTVSPTWLDDSWGGDKWDGGSNTNTWSGGNQWSTNNKWNWNGGSSNAWSNNNKWGWTGGNTWNNNNYNKWGWSGGNQWSNNNNQWGSSAKSWNHDGWHQDGWQDDGWNDDGHNMNAWKGDDDKANLRRCDLSDCCFAVRRGTDYNLYRRFLRTEDGNSNRCRLRSDDGGTGDWEKCNKKGFCYATDEGCLPEDC